MLATKLLQTTANGVEMGGKEDFMSVVGSFVTYNQDRVIEYVREMASAEPPSTPMEAPKKGIEIR